MITPNKYGRGFSTRTGKNIIIDYICRNIGKSEKILDVGFGCGIYGKLLRTHGYRNIDGIDIYPEGIQELGLDQVYDQIFIENILDFDFNFYECIILGDVLEHLQLSDAKNLLENFILQAICNNLIISIPYQFHQLPTRQNPREEHLQSEVTREYMNTHYPYLKLLYSSEMEEIPGSMIAVYTWSRK